MKNIIVDNISTTYYVTEDGKCYNEKTGKYLKGQINYKNGYKSFNITLPSGNKKRIYAHRAVAQAFIPNPENKPQVNHIDGNKKNNCVENLEWVTEKENTQHSLENELKKFAHIFCFTKDKELVAEYKNCQEAADAVGISRTQIIMEVNKNENFPSELVGGFYWSKKNILNKVKEYKNLGKAKKVCQYDKKGKFIKMYNSCGEAARATGANHRHISECCRGKLKSHHNFVWRYQEDIVSPFSES